MIQKFFVLYFSQISCFFQSHFIRFLSYFTFPLSCRHNFHLTNLKSFLNSAINFSIFLVLERETSLPPKDKYCVLQFESLFSHFSETLLIYCCHRVWRLVSLPSIWLVIVPHCIPEVLPSLVQFTRKM